MGSSIASCVKVYDEYNNEKRENQHLVNRDHTNSVNKGNERYHYKSFLDDNSFMENQKWINEKNQNQLLFHREKLVSAYQDYQFDQQILEKLWRRVERSNIIDAEFQRDIDKSICPKWKYLIRKGVSFEHMRMVILEIFKRTYESNEIHYQTVFQAAFKDRVPAVFKNVPTFTEKEHLPDMVKFHFLNENGGDALKRLLWLIRKIELIEYSPILTHVICFLLVFLSEAETFCVVRIMIDESRRILKLKPTSLKWHFTVREEDHLKLSQSFFEKIKSKSITGMNIVAHFEKIGFDYTSFFHLMSQNFFLEFLKISDILKFFPSFLNEGIKVHFRIVYAILKTVKKSLLNIHDKNLIERAIAEKCMNLTHSESHQLKKHAYNLSFSSNEYFSTTKITSKLHNLKTYYMPYIEDPSEFIGDEQFETIWEWLPSVWRISDPVLVFKCSRDGYHLPNLQSILKKLENRPMIMIMKTSEDIIFGVFANETLQFDKPNEYYGNNETFLFQLEPNEIKFPATGQNHNFIYTCREYFSFGDGDKGPAFLINGDLTSGRTNVSATFNNFAFTQQERDDRIFLKGIEIYLIN